MKILQNYVILNQLDLPTIEWKQFFDSTQLDDNLLWSIKVENGVTCTQKGSTLAEHKKNFPLSLLTRIKVAKNQKLWVEAPENALIGVDAETALKFGRLRTRNQYDNAAYVIYYPYYTVVKSGIIDINDQRTVIEATNGDIANLVKKNRVEMTMIFQDDDLQITGDEHFFSSDEMLSLIDYCKEVKKMVAGELEKNKNVQLYFSYMYQTSVTLKPVGEKSLIFYKFKIF